MDIAQQMGVGDEYVEIERGGGKEQWKALKDANPHGFDVVVSANLWSI